MCCATWPKPRTRCLERSTEHTIDEAARALTATQDATQPGAPSGALVGAQALYSEGYFSQVAVSRNRIQGVHAPPHGLKSGNDVFMRVLGQYVHLRLHKRRLQRCPRLCFASVPSAGCAPTPLNEHAGLHESQLALSSVSVLHCNLGAKTVG